MRAKEKYLKYMLKAFFCILLAVFCTLFSREVTQLFAYVTVQSVKSLLPSRGISVSAPDGDEPVRQQGPEVTERPTEQTVSAASPQKLSLKKDSLTAVDEDIAKVIKQAEKNASDDKKDGDIYEYTFTDDGVTDEFENIRVKNTNKTEIDIEKKLGEKLPLSVDREKPAVIIYHTHTTETYQLLDRDFYDQGYLSRSNDEGLNMVRVGKAIADEIEKRGFKVIHDTTVYDNPYTGAYYRSEDAVKKLLEENPSVVITLDVHRDAIQNDSGVKTKPTAEINGKKAAQIMLISGCQEEGNGITDLPDWEKNLNLALKLHTLTEEKYGAMSRPINLRGAAFNQHYSESSLLLEVGSCGNTLAEAKRAGELLADSLSDLIIKGNS